MSEELDMRGCGMGNALVVFGSALAMLLTSVLVVVGLLAPYPGEVARAQSEEEGRAVWAFRRAVDICVATGLGASREDCPVKLFDQACVTGHALACHNLGALYLQTRRSGKQRDPRAAEYFRQACDLGYSKGCTALGEVLVEGIGVDRSYGEAAKRFGQACKQGDTEGCYNLGLLYQFGGDGIRRSRSRAKELFRRACERDHAKSCERLRQMLPS